MIRDKQSHLARAVENGKQTIRALEKGCFDLAPVDIEHPDMKGTELLLRLKEKQPKMVKIIITGFPSLENVIKTVNEGANGYVLKPFDAKELLTIIRKQLDEKAARQPRTWSSKSEIERKNTPSLRTIQETRRQPFLALGAR